MKFLSARWKNLLFANYVVDPEILKEHVPPGTSVDLFEGKAYVSLVAFLFDRTRLLGLPIPFHRTFEEVNLRFYVAPEKDPSIRGVTFIKEIVPKRMITWVANTFFNENYETARMSHDFGEFGFCYRWGKQLENSFSVVPDACPGLPEPGSLGEFITEHYWGYAAGSKKTLEYRVEHPQWPFSYQDNSEISIDFAQSYGKKFGFLNNQEPASVFVAQGSLVSVSFPGKL